MCLDHRLYPSSHSGQKPNTRGFLLGDRILLDYVGSFTDVVRVIVDPWGDTPSLAKCNSLGNKTSSLISPVCTHRRVKKLGKLQEIGTTLRLERYLWTRLSLSSSGRPLWKNVDWFRRSVPGHYVVPVGHVRPGSLFVGGPSSPPPTTEGEGDVGGVRVGPRDVQTQVVHGRPGCYDVKNARGPPTSTRTSLRRKTHSPRYPVAKTLTPSP